MALPAAKFFVRVKAPYLLIPRGGRKVAGRIARDFSLLIEGFTQRYNELHSTNLETHEGLQALLDSGIDPSSLFTEYRPLIEGARGVISPWAVEPGFEEGYKWLTGEFGWWFVNVILPRPAKIDEFHSYAGSPLLTKVLVEHPRGRAWIEAFIKELKNFLYPGHASDASS